MRVAALKIGKESIMKLNTKIISIVGAFIVAAMVGSMYAVSYDKKAEADVRTLLLGALLQEKNTVVGEFKLLKDSSALLTPRTRQVLGLLTQDTLDIGASAKALTQGFTPAELYAIKSARYILGVDKLDPNARVKRLFGVGSEYSGPIVAPGGPQSKWFNQATADLAELGGTASYKRTSEEQVLGLPSLTAEIAFAVGGRFMNEYNHPKAFRAINAPSVSQKVKAYFDKVSKALSAHGKSLQEGAAAVGEKIRELPEKTKQELRAAWQSAEQELKASYEKSKAAVNKLLASARASFVRGEEDREEFDVADKNNPGILQEEEGSNENARAEGELPVGGR